MVIAYPRQLAHAARHDGLANPVSPVMWSSAPVRSVGGG